MTLIAVITIFVLAVFVGLEVIAKVPQTLHTPLMSATNAIHGVILVGGVIVLLRADDTVGLAIGFLAVLFGVLNVVGGFVVTDRMLEMFKRKPRSDK
ncbi:MAG: NAD(P) transhydrogenase subunit alpha [Chthonomonas sp.]|nr:NAD(P) transhydrogenase subunit alpha [Chthonomonas sp.]